MSSRFESSTWRNEEQIRSKGGRRNGLQFMSELEIRAYLQARDVLRNIKRSSRYRFLDKFETNLHDQSAASSDSFDQKRNRAHR